MKRKESFSKNDYLHLHNVRLGIFINTLITMGQIMQRKRLLYASTHLYSCCTCAPVLAVYQTASSAAAKTVAKSHKQVLLFRLQEAGGHLSTLAANIPVNKYLLYSSGSSIRTTGVRGGAIG